MLPALAQGASSDPYQLTEEWVGAVGPRQELGMELDTYHKGMIGQLDNLDQPPVGGEPCGQQAH